MSSITLILMIACAIAWMVAPFRQFTGKYYHLFMIYGVIELFRLVEYLKLVRQDNILTACLGFVLIYLLLLTHSRNLKKIPVLSGMFILIMYVFVMQDEKAGLTLILLQHSIIFIILLTDAYRDMVEQLEINMFYVFMLLNEINTIFMSLNAMYIQNTLWYFPALQTGLGFALALWFCIYRYDTPKLGIKI